MCTSIVDSLEAEEDSLGYWVDLNTRPEDEDEEKQVANFVFKKLSGKQKGYFDQRIRISIFYSKMRQTKLFKRF